MEALTLSGLSAVLITQWPGEALILLPLRHQLQAADELGLAHTGPLLITSFRLSPVEINKHIAHDAPYLLLSLLCTSTCFPPFLFLDVLCFEESQAGLCSFS